MRFSCRLAPAAWAHRVRRFVHEAKAETATARFIAMELIEGRTLREMIGSPLTPDALASVGTQIAKALAVAHALESSTAILSRRTS